VKLGDALLADLTNTLASEAHLGTNLLETTLLASDTEALLYNLKFTILENVAQNVVEIGCERLVVDKFVGTGIIARAEHIGHRVIVVLAKWGIDTHVVAICLGGLLDL
jgi:hypothetical protein